MFISQFKSKSKEPNFGDT